MVGRHVSRLRSATVILGREFGHVPPQHASDAGTHPKTAVQPRNDLSLHQSVRGLPAREPPRSGHASTYGRPEQRSPSNSLPSDSEGISAVAPKIARHREFPRLAAPGTSASLEREMSLRNAQGPSPWLQRKAAAHSTALTDHVPPASIRASHSQSPSRWPAPACPVSQHGSRKAPPSHTGWHEPRYPKSEPCASTTVGTPTGTPSP